VWTTTLAFEHLQQIGQADTKRTAERRLHGLGVLPPELNADTLTDQNGARPTPSILSAQIDQARQSKQLVLFAQLHETPTHTTCLHLNDARGARYWTALDTNTHQDQPTQIQQALAKLQQHLGKELTLFPHAALVARLRHAEPIQGVTVNLHSYPKTLDLLPQLNAHRAHSSYSPHLKNLQDESIYIIREAVAESENPVMLYSLGKDSSVMLHLARKAFYPSKPPFPLLHVDTRYKFQEMYLFRDHMANVSGMELLIHTNPEAITKNINPFDHGSALHTDITKTEGLKQALDQHKFDVIFGGARRDEEKSRAKERIFSFRTITHQWDPKNQRPEVWSLYNTRKAPGESIRVFPLSNWTELDIWQYIYQENIPVVPLYFAKPRPVVIRNGMIMMVDDERMRIHPHETIQIKNIRFRTLGCYPLTGAIESTADNIADIILELVAARQSERQGRAIDSDASASMEKKKQEGYF
jgi:sulfate adenylyltransferase subunit 2